jgi:hypothetical protein
MQPGVFAPFSFYDREVHLERGRLGARTGGARVSGVLRGSLHRQRDDCSFGIRLVPIGLVGRCDEAAATNRIIIGK